MPLVDTHCHIQSIGQKIGERHTRELWVKAETTAEDVIKRAQEADIEKLICVGSDLEDSVLAVDFVNNRENCWASIGIHPHEAQDFANDAKKMAEFEELASKPKVIAVGECGLDYYYEHSPKKEQFEVFEKQLDIAKRHNLPLIFHVREAFEDFWPIYDNFGQLPGVLHSFTDNSANLEKALERNLNIGVNGIATFAKDEQLLNVYKSIPSQNLLLETDAPYLTPTPYRGSINEPMRVSAVADFLAQLRDEDREELAAQTTANANNLFRI